MRRIVLAFLSLAMGAVVQAPRYSNPVIAGDHPDPSIVRAGSDYWATSTTSQWAPVFPLLHSRDLVNWTLEGSVFEEPPAWSAGSYWAPEIAEYRGRYFVYYTARRKDGPLCVAVATASKPAGPWTDQGPLVCQEAGSIDASPVTGEDGRRPCFGDVEKMQSDPAWRDNVLFNEYFHGDTGAGLGASHQTGWTGIVADMIRRSGGAPIPSLADLMTGPGEDGAPADA
jgi:hypothetical protein